MVTCLCRSGHRDHGRGEKGQDFLTYAIETQNIYKRCSFKLPFLPPRGSATPGPAETGWEASLKPPPNLPPTALVSPPYC